jgi:hypothetical protein
MWTTLRMLAGLVVMVTFASRAAAAGGTASDNGGNVFVTYAPTHWSDGTPEVDFNLRTAPDGLRRDLLRYSGWWVRPADTSAEARLGNPADESYDANGNAVFFWNCQTGTTCVTSELGRVIDAFGPNGAGTFVSELRILNSSSESSTIDVFHFLDPTLFGSAGEAAFVQRAHVIDFDSLPFERRLRYRASGYPVSRCSGDASSTQILPQLNDSAPTTLTQTPANSGVSSSQGVHCAMQWHLTIGPGKTELLRISVTHGIPDIFIKGDFNLDNQPDIYFEEASTLTRRVWPMKGHTRFQNPVDFDLVVPPDFTVVGVGDFDRDYRSDLLLRRTTTPHDLIMTFGQGTGFLPGYTSSGVPARGPEWELAATGDFDRNGHTDILWRNTTTQALEISIMDGVWQTAVTSPTPNHAVDANWKVVMAADWDRDNDLDLLWYNATSGKIVFWWLDSNYQRVQGGFADPPNAGDANWSVVAASDFGPGPAGTLPTAFATPDILWRNATSSRLVVWFMDALGRRTSGLFTSPDVETPNYRVVGPR